MSLSQHAPAAPAPVHTAEGVTIYAGDALAVLEQLPDGSVHGIATDPPYGLEFMGEDWDAPWRGGDRQPAGAPYRAYQAWCERWAAECLRVLTPGGHLLSFGGSRTAHRLTCAVEDVGFEIRDGITWLYAQGFPKSVDVGRVTGDATCWHGWGTALKPAQEPITVARKPLVGTVAANVLAHSTGGLNIDGCRVPAVNDGERYRANAAGDRGHLHNPTRAMDFRFGSGRASDLGRWPTNVVLSHGMADDGTDACADRCVPGCPVAELDTQSGLLTSGANPTRRNTDKFRNVYGAFQGAQCVPARGADSGGASRFYPVFRYQTKAGRAERFEVDGVRHPTVKPLTLMRWLVRLITPPHGVVLDPFLGSGTTAAAALLEGVRFLGIERDRRYLKLIAARLDAAAAERDAEAAAAASAAQTDPGLFDVEV